MSKFPTTRTAVRIIVGALAVASVVLATDLLLTKDTTARGAVVAGVPAGHLHRDEAQGVIDELSARTTEPVWLRTAAGTAMVDAASLGLTFDPDATLERLMQQPKNPVTRLAGMAGVPQTIDPVVHIDRVAFDSTLDEQQPTLEQAAVEGGVRYDGTTPVEVMPVAGERVAHDAAAATLAERWLDGRPIDLPVEDFDPTVSTDVVRETAAGPAVRAVAGPLTLTGSDNETVRVEPAQLGSILSFGPDGQGGLKPVVDPKKGAALLGPRLAATERKPVDATFSVRTGSPTVVPSRAGARVDWTKTFASIAAVATGADASDERVVEVAYKPLPARLTTEDARKLGVREVVGEFTTSGFTSASGENIRLVADEVDGALILPGKTFSLNTHTGPRGTAQGYVTSTIIDHGHAAKAVGGGISQFATTLYNASYFAGLEDVDHTEHSYYISRYPEAREATVFEGAIDLVFRNNTPHGVYIETNWTPSDVTVRMWSTTTMDVESITGDRHSYTEPPLVKLPKGDDCMASSGSRGFTTSNTRVISDAESGAEVRRHTRTVKYDPEPKVACV
ncbi:VanW family protein [Gordonia sp. DT218]|uniref:VanW family protein n=1 Tax=Gordonia sp. DT218 TaxID=3416659 RepID=UPI003CE679DE